MITNHQCLFLGTCRTPPIFASLRDLCGFAVNSSHLVAGESEAIAMSLEWPADLLIMDESSGRAMARNLNIRITGTLGVLLKAKRDGQMRPPTARSPGWRWNFQDRDAHRWNLNKSSGFQSGRLVGLFLLSDFHASPSF